MSSRAGAPVMPSANLAGATHPVTDVHAGEHSPGDIHFLYQIASNLRGSVSMADAHRQEGQHPEVTRLADEIATTHSAQLVQVDGLKARLSSGAAGASTTAGASGHGQSGGAGDGGGYGGQGGGRSRLEVRAADSSKPYGNVTYADPGYQSDGVKRYPLDTEAHCRAAWSYINQAKNAAKYSSEQLAAIKGRIKAAAKRFGIEISDQSNSRRDPEGMFERAFDFELAPSSDGLTLEGYAAVFNSPTRIQDLDGEFDEVIAPGAFQRTLSERMPVLMFEHGRHPLLGKLPLGVIERAEEDTRGLHIEARLSDNWLIEPFRDAVRDGAVDGMSFRFSVPKGGDRWQHRHGDVDLRTVLQTSVPELGPVVFPAYEPTTAQIRSALDCIDCGTGQLGARSAGGGASFDAQPSNGAASRIRAAIRVLDVHPLQSKEHYRA